MYKFRFHQKKTLSNLIFLYLNSNFYHHFSIHLNQWIIFTNIFLSIKKDMTGSWKNPFYTYYTLFLMAGISCNEFETSRPVKKSWNVWLNSFPIIFQFISFVISFSFWVISGLEEWLFFFYYKKIKYLPTRLLELVRFSKASC